MSTKATIAKLVLVELVAVSQRRVRSPSVTSRCPSKLRCATQVRSLPRARYAQALGDGAVLPGRGRPVLRLTLAARTAGLAGLAGLAELAELAELARTVTELELDRR
jgi:hypothetical protein